MFDCLHSTSLIIHLLLLLFLPILSFFVLSFIVLFLFGSHTCCCSGITPVRLRGPYRASGIELGWLVCVQGKHHIRCTIAPAPLSFYIF